MSVDSQLQPGEEVLYRAATTRISLIPRVSLLALAAAAALVAWHRGSAPLAVALGAIALVLAVWALGRLLRLRSNEYVLTTHRLILQTGLLGRSSMDSRLDKVNNVELRQTLWGRIFNYGDLEIDTASETGAALFPRLSHPQDFKRAILTAVEDYRTRRLGPHLVSAPPPPVMPIAPIAPVAQAPVTPPAERIRQLKKLLDEGLISPQEFEAKRRQALEEM